MLHPLQLTIAENNFAFTSLSFTINAAPCNKDMCIHRLMIFCSKRVWHKYNRLVRTHSSATELHCLDIHIAAAYALSITCIKSFTQTYDSFTLRYKRLLWFYLLPYELKI